MAAVKIYGKWGFIDKAGKMQIENIYDEVKSFKENIALVKQYGNWGFINKRNKILCRPVFEKANSFSNGLARVSAEGKCGFVNEKGETVIPFRSKYAGDFNNRLAPVRTENRKWGFIDRDDQLILSDVYDEAGPFENGIAIVKRRPKYGAIDKMGESRIAVIYDDLLFIGENLIKVSINGLSSLINEKGETISEMKYNEISNFKEGMAKV